MPGSIHWARASSGLHMAETASGTARAGLGVGGRQRHHSQHLARAVQDDVFTPPLAELFHISNNGAPLHDTVQLVSFAEFFWTLSQHQHRS